METLIHADIFFFITTVSLVVISLGLVIAIIYLIKILRDISAVSHKVKDESAEIIADLKHIRGTIKQQAFSFGGISQIIGLIFRRKKSKRNE
ncbi:MAG: hypothetical protein V4519_01405 [Patescibacteria group bacterium]